MDVKYIPRRGKGMAGRAATRAAGARAEAAPPRKKKGAPAATAGEALVEFGRAAAALPTRLGLDGLDSPEGGTLVIEGDAEAVGIAEAIRAALPHAREVQRATGVSAAALGAALDQHGEIVETRAAAEQIDEDLADTDRAAGRRERDALGELDQILDGLLAGRDPQGKAARDLLRAEAAEYLSLRQEEEESARESLGKTLKDAATHAAALAEADREAQLYRTMAELREGRPVRDEDLDQALATYEAMTSAPARGDRRGRGR